MADTMPKEDQSGQPEVAEAPLPAWVGPVKVAVMIMSVYDRGGACAAGLWPVDRAEP